MFPRARTWTASGYPQGRPSSVPPPPPSGGVCPPCLREGLGLECTPGTRPCPPCLRRGRAGQCVNVANSTHPPESTEYQLKNLPILPVGNLPPPKGRSGRHGRATFDDTPFVPEPALPLPRPLGRRPSFSSHPPPLPVPPLRRRPSFSAQPHGLPPLPPLPGQPSFSAGSHPLPMPPMRPFSSQGSYPSSMPPRQSSSFPPESLPQRPLQRRPCFTSQPGPGAGPSQPLTPAKPTAKPAVFPPVYMVMGWNWKVLRVSDAALETLASKPDHLCGRWFPNFIAIAEHERWHALVREFLPRTSHTGYGIRRHTVDLILQESWDKLKEPAKALSVGGEFHFRRPTGEMLFVRIQLWRSTWTHSGEYSGLVIAKITPIEEFRPGLVHMPSAPLGPPLPGLPSSSTGRSTSMGFHPASSRRRTSSLSGAGLGGLPPLTSQHSLPPLPPLGSMSHLPPPRPISSGRTRTPSFVPVLPPLLYTGASYSGDADPLESIPVQPDMMGRSAWGILDTYDPLSYKKLINLPPPPTHTPKGWDWIIDHDNPLC